MRLSPGYYVFVVKEYADGKPWIMMERRDQGLEVLKRAFIGFDSQDGTSSIEAEKLAAALNALIKNVSRTAPRK